MLWNIQAIGRAIFLIQFPVLQIIYKPVSIANGVKLYDSKIVSRVTKNN
jgi:hypothetical protein